MHVREHGQCFLVGRYALSRLPRFYGMANLIPNLQLPAASCLRPQILFPRLCPCFIAHAPTNAILRNQASVFVSRICACTCTCIVVVTIMETTAAGAASRSDFECLLSSSLSRPRPVLALLQYNPIP